MGRLICFCCYFWLGCEPGSIANDFDTDSGSIIVSDVTIPSIGLWVDSHCEVSEISAILKATEIFNSFTTDVVDIELITLKGYRNDDHSVPNRQKKTVACYYTPPYWWEGGYKGEAYPRSYIDLFLFAQPLSFDGTVSLMLHELMHYAGVWRHSEDPEAVMYTSNDDKSEYTVSDEELFCEYFECLE